MANLNIKFNNKSYSIDSASLADATATLEAHLMGMMEERLEGDGAEYYTLAPTALSFRSTAPLNELQEVQINGVTVDPTNYTLEEGSTIVTFPIDYLKTLNVGNYEVAVASDSKTVKGGFNVKAPELNEHGFYYNQPYAANVPTFGGTTVFFLREDGTMDVTVLDNGYIETCSYTVDENNLTINAAAGTFTGTASEAGIYCNELYTNFVLGDTSIAADEDYLYIYKEDLGGYEVKCIDETKTRYGAIKTGINDIDTVKLKDQMFMNNPSLIIAPAMPNSITSIGDYAFSHCSRLNSVIIPEGVTSIGEASFGDCTSLEGIIIPDSVAIIGKWAFDGCSSLLSIAIPNSVINIGDYAFRDCKRLTSVEISNSVTNIGTQTFRNCYKLSSIVIPDSITSIGDSAFSNCDNLTSVTIPDSVTSIGDSAFSHAYYLHSVKLGCGVTDIGAMAFSNCLLLNDITFNGTIAQLNTITFGNGWNSGVPATHVHCIDGDVAL